MEMSSPDDRFAHRRAPLVVAVFLLLMASSEAHSQGAAQSTVIQTGSGAVRGRAHANYTEWLGIPYAAAPIGDLRWRPPQPHPGWSGVRDATAAGSACVQGTGWDPGYERPRLTEDCLFVNVYRPHGTSSGELLPVFVWVHGGGLRGGAGYDVDPRKFLSSRSVIFVSLNYRLGAMGFLALPALTTEDRGAVGNYGMLDQQAALRWVQTNIRQFGGDPSQVTIAGQSAGGRSVCNQLASPTAKGLFARAIHQSGSCDSIPIATAEATGKLFAAALGCTDPATSAACLRSKSPADILATQDEIRISTTVFGGAHFPRNPVEAVRAGAFNRVPVLMGQTYDERTQSMFASHDFIGRPVTAKEYEGSIRERYGPQAAQVIERYPVSAYWSPTVALATVEGDQASCRRSALYAAFAAATPTYVYEFDERDPPAFVSIWRLNTTFRFGATHVNELGYLFDYLRQALPFSSAQGELSDTMIRYWSAFTRSGNPNAEALPAWPLYSPASDEMISLKAGGVRVKTSFKDEHKCGFWVGLPVS